MSATFVIASDLGTTIALSFLISMTAVTDRRLEL